MPQRERDLHLAVMGNDKTTVHQIVNQGVDLDYPWSNPAIPSIKDSTTPLLAAVSLNHVEITLVPCIKLLFSHGCDMLNLMDWLKWKGPGIPEELLADDEAFFQWYKENMTSPLPLRNLCRKIIQHQLCRHDNTRLLDLIPMLPLPPSLHLFLSRKMFHHDIS
nr:hypothetical protein BaRGS_006430 [Batillaria attramentaria]